MDPRARSRSRRARRRRWRRRRVAPREDRPLVPAVWSGRSSGLRVRPDRPREPTAVVHQPPQAPDVAHEALAIVSRGDAMPRDLARSFLEAVLDGDVTPAQLGGVLLAIRVRTETTEELAGFVEAMRSRVLVVAAPGRAPSTPAGPVATSARTFNISTATSLVTAAAGVPIAKHGNRAVSSQSGSSDAIAALGLHGRADAGGRRGIPARDGLRVPPRARRSTRACATPARCVASWACAPRSTSSGRWPTRRS